MAGKKKRAPGGGRKPRGEIGRKNAVFSTRIRSETRALLKKASDESGKSISQIAEWAMIEGLAARERARSEQGDPLHWLCYVVVELSQMVCNFKNKKGEPAFDWRTHPFFFQAFKLAIGKFLDAMSPPGKMRSPMADEPGLKTSTAWGPHNTPEARAEWAVMLLLALMQNAKPMTSATKTLGFAMPLEMNMDMAHLSTSMSKARDALLKR